MTRENNDWIRIALLLGLLLIAALAFGQCGYNGINEGDTCDNPIIYTPGECDNVESVTLCNYFCGQEEGGYTNCFWCATCATQEKDFWLEITITQADWYILSWQTDYTWTGSTGTQMFFYNEGLTCEDFSSYNLGNAWVYRGPCIPDETQDIMDNFWLDEGTYLIQIDGNGWSEGCGEFALCTTSVLRLGVEELKKVKNQLTGQVFNILGQRVEHIGKN